MKPTIHKLENGRIYRLTNHGEYKGGEYPSGGIHIATWEPRLNKGKGMWLYVSNAPNKELAQNFLNAAKRLKPI